MTDFIFKKYPSLSDNNFVRFALAQFFSLSGGFIQNVALSAMISDSKDKVSALGIFLFVSYLPVFLLSFYAGRITARIPLKSVLVITEASLFVMSCILSVFPDMPFYSLLIFGGAWGTVRAFQTPAASSVPKLICDEKTLPSAVNITSLALSLSRAAGPVISGVIYTAFGYRAAFITNAVSYLPSILLLLSVKIPEKKNTAVKKSKPTIPLFLIILLLVISLFGTCYNTFFTGVCEKLTLSKLWFSVFMGAVGVGAVLGVFVPRNRKTLAFAGLGMGVASGVLALSKNGYLAVFICIALGFFDYLFFSSALVNINLKNDENSIGAAMGVYTAVTTGALPVSYLVMSYATRYLGVNTALFISAFSILLTAGFYLTKFVDN